MDERTERQQRQRIRRIRPGAHEVEGDGRLERFQLHQRIDGKAGCGTGQDQRQRHIFEPLQARIHGAAQCQLRQPAQARQLAGELLQRAERAQPAAEGAPAPQQQRHQHESPQRHRHRILQQKRQAAPCHQGLDHAGEIDDRQLRLRVVADKADGKQQVGNAKPVKAAAVGADLARPRQGQRQHRQAQRQDQKIDPARLPGCVPPGVARCGNQKPRRYAIGDRQFARDALGVELALAARDRHREIEGGTGIEARFGRNPEHRQAGVRRHGDARQQFQVEIEVAQVDRQLMLAQQQAIGNAAARKIVARHAVAARRDDENRLVALLYPGFQLGQAGFGEQAACHRRHRHTGEVQIDKDGIRLAQSFFIEPRAIAARIALFHFAVRHAQMAQQTIVLQALERQRFHYIGAHAGNPLRALAGAKTELAARHQQGCRQHAFIDDAHRDRGLGNAVDGHARGVRLARATGLGLDMDILLQRHPLVLPDEFEQRRLAQTVLEHRFMLRQHLDADKAPARVDRHQQVDRHARKTGNRRQVV